MFVYVLGRPPDESGQAPTSRRSHCSEPTPPTQSPHVGPTRPGSVSGELLPLAPGESCRPSPWSVTCTPRSNNSGRLSRKDVYARGHSSSLDGDQSPAPSISSHDGSLWGQESLDQDNNDVFYEQPSRLQSPLSGFKFKSFVGETTAMSSYYGQFATWSPVLEDSRKRFVPNGGDGGARFVEEMCSDQRIVSVQKENTVHRVLRHRSACEQRMVRDNHHPVRSSWTPHESDRARSSSTPASVSRSQFPHEPSVFSVGFRQPEQPGNSFGFPDFLSPYSNTLPTVKPFSQTDYWHRTAVYVGETGPGSNPLHHPPHGHEPLSFVRQQFVDASVTREFSLPHEMTNAPRAYHHFSQNDQSWHFPLSDTGRRPGFGRAASADSSPRHGYAPCTSVASPSVTRSRVSTPYGKENVSVSKEDGDCLFARTRLSSWPSSEVERFHETLSNQNCQSRESNISNPALCDCPTCLRQSRKAPGRDVSYMLGRHTVRSSTPPFPPAGTLDSMTCVSNDKSKTDGGNGNGGVGSGLARKDIPHGVYFSSTKQRNLIISPSTLPSSPTAQRDLIMSCGSMTTPPASRGCDLRSRTLDEARNSRSPLAGPSEPRVRRSQAFEGNSFGRRSPGSSRRTSECLTLEPAEMIVIDYPDAAAMKSASQARAVVSASNVEYLLQQQHEAQAGSRPMRRMNSDSVIEQMPDDAACGTHPYLGSAEQFYPSAGSVGGHEHAGGGGGSSKRLSRASDTSSAYSGSDVMHTSLDDPEAPDVDLSGLAESMVDSDDEEGYAESTESFTIRDAERDCLEKEPSERTEEDIQILLNFTQHLKAFSNMTEHTRRLLCEVMVFAIVPKEGTIVMKDGEELDSWSVILNGEVEITRPHGVRERLQMGDSFGISPTMEKLYHQGVMRTIVNDCQFVCIAQSSYYRILHQGEENILKHEEKGRVVMVTEHRELDGGNRKGHIVIRGTPERLMQHLVESHSAIDPTYVEDFLLTHRTFLSSPLDLVRRLLDWFQNDDLKTNVTKVVLLWVNNHFNDFETNHDMCEFLEHFECLLEKESENDFEKLMGQLSLLNMACAAKARLRTVTLTRATREEILHFSILGGVEKGHGIFVAKVQPQSKAAEAGLKRGDQILEVNGHKFQQIYYNKALEILRGTTHLSIVVKSNLQEFKDMLRASEKNTPRKVKREDGNVPNAKQRLSVPDLDSTAPMFTEQGDGKKTEKRSGIFGSTSRLRKALTRINFMPKNLNGRESGSINHSDESLYSKPSRKSSTSSSSSTAGGTLNNHLSASNPDITSVGLIVDDRNEMPEHVVKVYKSDQTFKYLLIHKETTAKEVVMLALQEFGITEPSCEFSLREVTVEMEKFIKSKRLPDSLNNLPERLNLNGRRALPRVLRYYLKNNRSSEPLIPDELIGQLLMESQISLLQLTAHEVAWQLTLNDYRVFREIEPTEYVDDLYNLQSKFGCAQLHKFAELVNKEMFWVVTEICSEANLVKRTKLLKHFIKIAMHCKDSKNFNSMFAILSGLGHGSISRLKLTWERLPSKYSKLFQDLQSFMDPSRNMAKYRNLINSVQAPFIPFFPIFKKDLTFIHLGNDSHVDGLVNFEKLRMIAKEVRNICSICSTTYDSNNMFLSTNNSFQSALVSGVTTLKRTKNRRGSALPNAKKMYEEAQMVRRVRSYLSNMPIISDEEKLTELSSACEAPVRRRDASPSVNNSPNMEEKRIVTPAGPKFGAESPGAVRKLMALSDKVRPHNPKIPVGKVVSPTAARRGPGGGPTSPRIGPSSRPLPVNLTPESSCLGQGPRKQPIRTGSMGSTDSASPTGSVRGFKGHYSSENDSGHSSIGSNVSPPQHRRLTAPAGPVYCPVPGQPPHFRPPLPSYSTVMHNSAAAMSAPVVSNYASHPGFPVGRRPPLPDYQAATNMAQMARRQQQQQQMRAYSHDTGVYIGVGHGPVAAADSDYDTPPVEGGEEEQVSAV
ncbi:rap guanine nucleotide exchange factor 2 isoform X2 [Aplysia californica]|uniref:Rap guanine nucleotide exchange factor 2 isoform X2 n=1 Tax=Aplysia californica TaxID=6500 RepID=A0ABM0JZE5_APLCA|nr:rap guanine nucleotide exchange factor 2 isoform X2 [Aplysia californica]